MIQGYKYGSPSKMSKDISVVLVTLLVIHHKSKLAVKREGYNHNGLQGFPYKFSDSGGGSVGN